MTGRLGWRLCKSPDVMHFIVICNERADFYATCTRSPSARDEYYIRWELNRSIRVDSFNGESSVRNELGSCVRVMSCNAFFSPAARIYYISVTCERFKIWTFWPDGANCHLRHIVYHVGVKPSCIPCAWEIKKHSDINNSSDVRVLRKIASIWRRFITFGTCYGPNSRISRG